ncbi:hypothetical protein TIFTF001_029736 [Ficus carica]|uniref:Myb/SANT-like domain-containing protein n=1 Tax=Ficus carica TaxID=3494 RepID=A0AA88J386_FICCA|nr:hypothetical protein TIFTF001_029736 [Ficus carica]
MKKIYRGWKALQVRTGLGYDPSMDKVICSDDAWQSFIQQVPRGLGQLRCAMTVLHTSSMKGNNRRASIDAGPSWSRGSSGKRKQREETDEMTYVAIQEIVSHFRSRSQYGASNGQSSRPDHLLMCMNVMIEMGVPQYQWTIMWHYFDAHPRLQCTFHQLPDDDRRGIIASVVKSQSPPAG